MQTSFNSVIKGISYIFIAISISACSDNTEGNEPVQNTSIESNSTSESIIVDTVSTDSVTNDVYHSETFETTGQKGWGYRIMLNGELYINQPHIPAIQGNKGFSNPVFAKKTADYAISKIEQGIIPPTLTVEELDSLGVLN